MAVKNRSPFNRRAALLARSAGMRHRVHAVREASTRSILNIYNIIERFKLSDVAKALVSFPCGGYGKTLLQLCTRLNVEVTAVKKTQLMQHRFDKSVT